MTGAAIEDCALIGDLHTAALVALDGSIDWLCVPRFDSPACFAALLHDESAGHWRLAPANPAQANATRRVYRTDTLILDTEWDVDGGSVRVTDFMPPREDGAHLVRVVTGLRGRVAMKMHLVIRFDYGHVMPWVRHDDTGLFLRTLPRRFNRSGWRPCRHYRLLVEVDRALPVRRVLAARCPPRIDNPQSPDLRTDRRRAGCGDHVAAGGVGRIEELGLPVLLAA